MQFMRINYTLLFTIGSLLFFTSSGQAQSEGLTSSPYSLYGIGVFNQNTIGVSSGLGHTGIGYKSAREINNLNPANFALIPQNSFLYDVGVSGQYNKYQNNANEESKKTGNFSNIALAFRLMNNLGIGVSMSPYTDVGYSLIGVRKAIENTENEEFESVLRGIGGLNDIKINLGYGITKKIRVGISASILFGGIEKTEAFAVETSSFLLDKKTNYSGVRFGGGLQYDITKNITAGATLLLPTDVKGKLKRNITKSINGLNVIIEDDVTSTVEDFKLPLEIGFGIGAQLNKNFLITADYKRSSWDDTDQTESIARFSNQDIYGMGVQYIKDPLGFKYIDRIRLRAGVNHDSGYLSINDTKVDGTAFTLGIGLPLSGKSHSLLNISYSYGSKGQMNDVLIKETFHSFKINLSLEDFWFKKRVVF